MALLRSQTLTESYATNYKAMPAGTCGLCADAALKSYRYWKIIENKFPYDLIANEHHMLVPIRHATEEELEVDELMELAGIKHNLDPKYDCILEATNKNKSIPSHYHLHLLVIKPDLESSIK
jgi:hypothetical protein